MRLQDYSSTGPVDYAEAKMEKTKAASSFSSPSILLPLSFPFFLYYRATA